MHNNTKKSSESRRGRTLLIIGVCKPGLAILTIAYLLLVLSVILTILFPHSLAGKVVALVAYLLTAGFFSYKSYKAMHAPVVKRRKRHVPDDPMTPQLDENAADGTVIASDLANAVAKTSKKELKKTPPIDLDLPGSTEA